MVWFHVNSKGPFPDVHGFNAVKKKAPEGRRVDPSAQPRKVASWMKRKKPCLAKSLVVNPGVYAESEPGGRPKMAGETCPWVRQCSWYDYAVQDILHVPLNPRRLDLVNEKRRA